MCYRASTCHVFILNIRSAAIEKIAGLPKDPSPAHMPLKMG